MEQREEFVLAVEAGNRTISELCREFGISRKTGYKWINRSALGQQLCDQSRCPHRQPSKTARETEQLILDVRASNPTWGGKKIKAAGSKLSEEYMMLQNHLCGFFGSKVQLSCTAKGKGKISIPFNNEEDLERIMEILDSLKKEN